MPHNQVPPKPGGTPVLIFTMYYITPHPPPQKKNNLRTTPIRDILYNLLQKDRGQQIMDPIINRKQNE